MKESGNDQQSFSDKKKAIEDLVKKSLNEVAGLKKDIEELSQLKELHIKELESSLLNIDEENTMLLSRINDLTRLSENMANDLIQQSEFIEGSFESLAAYKNFTQNKNKNIELPKNTEDLLDLKPYKSMLLSCLALRMSRTTSDYYYEISNLHKLISEKL